MSTKRQAALVESVVKRIVFPRGLKEKIRSYATGMRTMRETASKFSDYELTREMLIDIANGAELLEETTEVCHYV